MIQDAQPGAKSRAIQGHSRQDSRRAEQDGNVRRHSLRQGVSLTAIRQKMAEDDLFTSQALDVACRFADIDRRHIILQAD